VWKPPENSESKYGEAVLVLDVFGTFYEKLKLDNFPLDCQDFVVDIWSLRSIDEQLLCRPEQSNMTVLSLYMQKISS